MATWITPTHDGSRYTANGAMTWTVDGGDATTFKYRLVDTTILVAFHLDTTSVGGTPNTQLRIAVPESRQAATTMEVPVLIIDNGTRRKGKATVTATTTTIVITRLDGGTFAAAANTTGVYGQMRMEFRT